MRRLDHQLTDGVDGLFAGRRRGDCLPHRPGLHPDAICPHTLSNRSVIVSLDACIQVKVLSEKPETILSADGQNESALSAGDTITVCRSRHSVRLMHLRGTSFFETLRRKLHWSGSNVGAVDQPNLSL